MGKKIFIDSIVVCDVNGDAFPMSGEVNGAYVVPFSPAPLGSTGIIYLKVTCTLTPDGQAQTQFRLKNLNLTDFEFTMGVGQEIKYIRETSTGAEISLPFEVRNKKPFDGDEPALTLSMRLLARDSEPNSPSETQKTVVIIGTN